MAWKWGHEIHKISSHKYFRGCGKNAPCVVKQKFPQINSLIHLIGARPGRQGIWMSPISKYR